MVLNQRFIVSLVTLAGLAYSSSAIGGFNPGPIQIHHPEKAAEAGNNKPAPDLPAEPCDVDRLTNIIHGFMEQRVALVQELGQLAQEYKAGQSSGASDATLAALDAQMTDLRHRIIAIDDRTKGAYAQIVSCQSKAGNPSTSTAKVPSGGDGQPPSDGSGPPSGHNGPALADNLNRDESPKADLRVSCKVPKGDETRSVLFRNVGQKLIPAGTPVTWYIKVTGQGGKFSLPHALPVGAELTAADLLKLGVPGNTNCRSKI